MSEQTSFAFGQCPHWTIIVVPEKRGPHVAKRICKDCKKFFGWEPKPENVERKEENAKILTALSKLELPAWEREFIRTLVTHKHISPRQQAKLLEIRDVYLKNKDP